MARLPRLLTIDASVFLNAYSAGEAGREASQQFIRRVRADQIPLFLPSLLPVEIAAGILRVHQSSTLAREMAAAVCGLGQAVLVPLDEVMMKRSIEAGT